MNNKTFIAISIGIINPMIFTMLGLKGFNLFFVSLLVACACDAYTCYRFVLWIRNKIKNRRILEHEYIK